MLRRRIARLSQPQGRTAVDASNQFANRRWALIHIPGQMPYGDANPKGNLIGTTRIAPTRGGLAIINTSTTAPQGWSYGVNAQLQLSTSCGIAVFVNLGAAPQPLYDTSYGASVVAYGLFVDCSGGNVRLLHKDQALIAQVSAQPVGEVGAVAWSYNASTGRARIACAGRLASATVARSLTHNQAAVCGYWTDNNTGTTPATLLGVAVSPEECFSDDALIQASINPWQLFAPIQQPIWVPVGASGGAGSATGVPSALSLSATAATATGAASATSSPSALPLVAPVATATGAAAATAAPAALAITAPVAVGTGAASATATPSAINLAAPAATASAMGAGNATGAPSALGLAAPTVTATGAATATASPSALSLSGPTATASAAGAGNATGSPASLLLTAPTATAAGAAAITVSPPALSLAAPAASAGGAASASVAPGALSIVPPGAIAMGAAAIMVPMVGLSMAAPQAAASGSVVIAITPAERRLLVAASSRVRQIATSPRILKINPS